MSVTADQLTNVDLQGEEIRVQGIVQGVGFRPTVWRLANELGLRGTVRNDNHGISIHVWGTEVLLNQFVTSLKENCPVLGRIDHIDRRQLTNSSIPESFEIIQSHDGDTHTYIPADASTCPDCIDDTVNPFSRRYRYPLTNCTHCGPRLSIIKGIPYDREQTSMAEFELCKDCADEYNEPTDRRFHAQPNACYVCGPEVKLERIDSNPVCMETLTQLDDVDAACTVLQNGSSLVIKGIGGFHLACDATNHDAVQQLRNNKQRYAKPFALMARDIDMIKRYAHVSQEEEKFLSSASAPIVILKKIEKPDLGTKREFGTPEGQRQNDLNTISNAVAPGQNCLGFMLPYTPMHHLLFKRMNRPIVLTSGNRSDEPQVINNNNVKERLADMAEYVLWHNRDIINRVDDSVTRVMNNSPRIIRRARGYAPSPLPLPAGFKQCPDILAMGGELKNTFCLIKDGQAIVSQHIGDLENAETYVDYKKNLSLYQDLFQHKAETIVIDEHPEYLPSKLGREKAEQSSIHLQQVQHHHSHIASCLAENNWGLEQGKVLGVALDGLGFGNDDTLWGGEFLLADYLSCERVATFKPVAMLGGAKAIYEPWRNTYAHLMAEMGWPQLKINFDELELVEFFESQALDTFNAMLNKQQNAPLASSCGRLFDAVAAAMDICREHTHYEGQAAIELEAIIDQKALTEEDELLTYPFAIPRLQNNNLPYIEPLGMWQALLGDLILKTPKGVMAARFHRGLAKVIATMVHKLCTQDEERWCNTIALSGGVFQNKTLFELVVKQLEEKEFTVLSHQQVPTNDGGLSLGQAAIAAARIIQERRNT
ncbi:MAG: carbamoyltransferase HypF [Gammaproteobacteria bacterium]